MAIWTPTVKPEKADLIKDLKRMADSIDTEKVQKETGKRLITNEEATKLAGLENYDDTELIKLIDSQNIDIKYLEKQVEQLLKDHKPIPFEGASSHLQDTGELPMPISINGGIEQDTRSGKNKFVLPESVTKGGITYTKNADGTFNMVGTATEDVTFDVYVDYDKSGLDFKNGLSYAISTNVNTVRPQVALYNDLTWLVTLFDLNYTTTPIIKTISNTSEFNKVRFLFKIATGKEVNITNGYVQLEQNTVVTEFEQYGAMPSLPFPSEVKGIGSEEDINLLDIRNAYEVTKAGVTLTVDKEKQEITLNGTCNADNTTFSLNTTLQCKAGEYTRGFKYVDGSVTIPSGKTSSINLQDSDWRGFVTNLINADYFQNHKIEIDLNISYTVIRCDSGCVYDNYKIKPFLASGSNKSYTPYGICRYENAVTNKNFFNLTVKEIDKVRYGITVNNSKNKIKYNGTVSTGSAINPNGWDYAPLKYKLPAGDYIFTLKKISGSYNKNSSSDAMYLRDENKGVLKDFSTFAYFIENNHQVKFTNPKTQTVHFQHYCNAGITFNNFEFEIQIEKDNGNATEIVEPLEQNLPLDIPIGQVWYSGKPYKENGKWYRTIEYKKEFLGGKIIERATTKTTGKYRFGFNLENAYRTNIASEKYAGYCNLLKQGIRDNTYALIPCIANTPVETDFYGTGGIIYMEEISQMTVEQANAYITEKGMYVVYKLAKADKEEITDKTLIAQYEAMQKAHSYYEVTNINSYRPTEDVAEMKLSGNALMSNDLRMSKLESALLNVSAEV